MELEKQFYAREAIMASRIRDLELEKQTLVASNQLLVDQLQQKTVLFTELKSEHDTKFVD
jgi:hypothetical protein